MKKRITLFALALLLTGGLFAQKELLTAWTFDGLPQDTSNPPTPLVILSNTDIGLQKGTAAIYADGTNGSDAFTTDDPSTISSFNGDVLNDPRTPATAGKALALRSNASNGNGIVFKFSTKGYKEIELSFAIRGTSTGFDTHTWSYSTDGTNFTPMPDNNTANKTTTFQKKTVDMTAYSAINNQDNVYIKLVVSGATSASGNSRLDNFQINATPDGPDETAPVLSSIEVINSSSIKLTFNEPLDKTIAETAGNYVFDKGINVTAAVLSDERYVLLSVNPLTEAEEYQLTINNIEDLAGNEIDEIVETVTFGVPVQYHKATIADLRAVAPEFENNKIVYNDTVYKLSGSAIVTYRMQQTQNLRNKKFIQDNTGALVIDDEANILSAVGVGDEVTAIYGKLNNYYGMIQFVPTAKASVLSNLNEVTPTVITIDQLDWDTENDLQAKLIVLEGVTFTPSSAEKFVSNKYYALTKDAVKYDSLVSTMSYLTADYIGLTIPTYVVDITGVVDFYRGKNRIMIRNNSDMVSLNPYSAPAVKLAPNPARDFVAIEVPNPVFMEIYTMAGQLISQEQLTAGTHILSVANFQAGIYIIRMTNTDNGNIRTAKLIVQ